MFLSACVLKAANPTCSLAQVIIMLVTLMYGLPGLDWTRETDHAELFSGGMSVTIGELEVGSLLLITLLYSLSFQPYGVTN